jgi:methylglutaconyl-CoA hydratase
MNALNDRDRMHTMSTSTLDVTRHAHVARIFLNRPDVRNASNGSVIAEMTQAFAAVSADASLRCIVLGGHGKAFCAGADLTWMRVHAFLNKRKPGWLEAQEG